MKNIFVFFLVLMTSILYTQDIDYIVTDADGGANGSIDLKVLLSGDYTFDWTDDNGNPINPSPNCSPASCFVDNLLPGHYCVKITDDNSGCILETCFDVQGTSCDKKFEAGFNTSAPICSNKNTGWITLSGTTADICWNLPGLSFQWSNGYSGQFNSNLSPGKYCLKVTADRELSFG